jgi:PadR family transcriptional regulator AphA
VNAEKVSSLSLTDWIVLALIDEEPRHGFSVARELKAEGSIGQVWTVARPLVYRSIEHLQSCATIEPIGTEPGAKGPVRTVFRITPAGKQELASWLDEPVEHPRDVRAELLSKFILIARRGGSLVSLATRQIAHFANVSSGLAEKALNASGSDRVIAIWRLESMRAVTQTLETILADERHKTRA